VETKAGTPTVIEGSPTRFGRISLRLEPVDGRRAWRLSFEREPGPQPASVSLPVTLGGFRIVPSGQVKVAGDRAEIDPSLKRWSVMWKA
jgi:hypothetical protein